MLSSSVREDESSLVVKFITTNEYLWVKYILNMEEDGTLAIDATYNTNVDNFCVWLFGMGHLTKLYQFMHFISKYDFLRKCT